VPNDQPIPTPHDTLIKEIFGRPWISAELFKAYLHPQVADLIDWGVLTLENGTYLDERTRSFYTDLLFSAKWRGEDIYLYLLLEHQTAVDRFQPIRMGSYVFGIWNDLIKKKELEGDGELPIIIPVVLHQGARWTGPKRVSEVLARPENAGAEAREIFRRWTPDFEFELIELPERDLEEIRGHIIGRATLGVMQAASQDRAAEFFREYEGLLEEMLRQPDTMGILRLLYTYATQVSDDRERVMEVFKALPNRLLRNVAMSVADQLKAEGMAFMLSQLLESRFHLPEGSLSTEISGLDPGLLNSLSKEIFNFVTLAELERWLAAHKA